MARQARAEVEGGLYHVITRGNNRRQIFNSPADYENFLTLLAFRKPSYHSSREAISLTPGFSPVIARGV